MDQDIAAKEIFTQMIDKENVQEFCREAGLLAQLHHPNIVQFFGVSIHNDNLYLVTEFCKFNLREAIEDDDVWVGLSSEAKQKIALGIASGISYLHQRGIAHRDLKPPNVLLTELLSVKLCDFGLASVAGEGGQAARGREQTMAIGTPQYMPPEIMQGGGGGSEPSGNGFAVGNSNLQTVDDTAAEKQNIMNDGLPSSDITVNPNGAAGYNEMKVDSYAFGILLYSLWTRREPYFGMNAFHVMTAVLLHDIRPDHSRLEFPPKLYQLMTMCWARNPTDRPTFGVIKKLLSAPNIINTGKIGGTGTKSVALKTTLGSVHE
jgi:serine/threonine protein kinase